MMAAANIATKPASRPTVPNIAGLEAGAGGSGSRSGASASWERSATTATSPAKTPDWALRLQGGSGGVAIPRGRPASTADAPCGLASFTSCRGPRLQFGAPSSAPSFGGSAFDGPSVCGPLSSDSRTGAFMIPSALRYVLAPLAAALLTCAFNRMADDEPRQTT